LQDIYKKYANLLVEYSLGLKAGDKLFINSTYLAEDLVRHVYRRALEVGAYPELKIGLDGIERIFYETANEEQLKYVSPLNKYVIENYDAMLNITSPFNLKELQSIKAEKKQMVSIARTDSNKTFMKRDADGSMRWTLCVFPTQAAAQQCGMSGDEYAEFVYSACFLFDDDPIASWRELHGRQQGIVDFLNQKKKIKFEAEDIDIEFSTEGRKWINSSGTHNMPSGEVFTSPVEDSVEGVVRFSYPGFYMGEEIEDIRLEVKGGEIIKADAKKGKNLLEKLLEVPGARRFGEAAVGTNNGITKFTQNMLFDEKIGGTIHMAVGAAYPTSGGKNESSVHWDMLADMKTGGRIFADGELVYKDGNFII
jgi:aminopeptidase